MRKTLLGTLLLALAAPAVAAGAPATHVIRFAVTDAGGKLLPGFTVTSNVRGSCWTGSLSTFRADAWRCMVGNEIRDPCYAPATNARVVYCPSSATLKSLLAITLTKPLPLNESNHGGANSVANPTMIVLSGGASCWFLTGASEAIHGMRANYGCSDGRVLVGDVDRSAPRWRIRAARSETATTTTFVDIDTAML